MTIGWMIMTLWNLDLIGLVTENWAPICLQYVSFKSSVTTRWSGPAHHKYPIVTLRTIRISSIWSIAFGKSWRTVLLHFIPTHSCMCLQQEVGWLRSVATVLAVYPLSWGTLVCTLCGPKNAETWKSLQRPSLHQKANRAVTTCFPVACNVIGLISLASQQTNQSCSDHIKHVWFSVSEIWIICVWSSQLSWSLTHSSTQMIVIYKCQMLNMWCYFFHCQDSIQRSSRWLTVSWAQLYCMCKDTDGVIPDDGCGVDK